MSKTELRQWTVRARLTYNTHVTVEAATADDARRVAKSGDFLDDGLDAAELVDFEICGEPKAVT